MFPAMPRPCEVLFEDFGDIDISDVEWRCFYAWRFEGSKYIVVSQKVGGKDDEKT